MEPKGLADDDDLAANYFAKLDVIIKPIVDQDVHDLFQVPFIYYVSTTIAQNLI